MGRRGSLWSKGWKRERDKRNDFVVNCLLCTLAVIFFFIYIPVIIIKKSIKKRRDEGGGNDKANVIGETIGGKPTIFNGGTNYGGTFGGSGKQELYNIILPTHTKRQIAKMTSKQIRAAAIMYASNGENIIADSSTIVSTTTKPDTFFKRLFVLGGRLHANAVIEKYYPIFNVNQRKQYAEWLADVPTEIDAFVNRYALETRQELAHRQTAAARRSYIQRRYDALDKYAENMTTECYNHFNRVFAEMVEKCGV